MTHPGQAFEQDLARSPSWQDQTIHPPGTILRGVKSRRAESRPWIDEFPESPALDQHHLIHAGIMTAVAGTRIVRSQQTSTYFIATLSGRGKVLIDGEWRPCGPGMACLLPAHTLNAFKTAGASSWKFCWACYQSADHRPVTPASSPVLSRFDAGALEAAITGLLHECEHNGPPGIVQSWADLVHAYVMRFAQPLEQDSRLQALWQRVATNLSDDWSLSRLTRESGYSREHLRRLCRSQLGRGPMHQVANLRMRRAAELLTTTGRTIESIALEVGYQNGFVFSNAFKKWIGCRPSEYRSRR